MKFSETSEFKKNKGGTSQWPNAYINNFWSTPLETEIQKKFFKTMSVGSQARKLRSLKLCYQFRDEYLRTKVPMAKLVKKYKKSLPWAFWAIREANSCDVAMGKPVILKKIKLPKVDR